MPIENKALEIVEKCLDKYFQHLCDDLPGGVCFACWMQDYEARGPGTSDAMIVLGQ